MVYAYVSCHTETFCCIRHVDERRVDTCLVMIMDTTVPILSNMKPAMGTPIKLTKGSTRKNMLVYVAGSPPVILASCWSNVLM